MISYIGRTLLDISDLMKDVCEPVFDVKQRRLKTCFVGSRPSAAEQRDEFIVIRASNPRNKKVEYRYTLYIDIYVRNKQNGVEKTERLEEISNRILKMFNELKIRRADNRWKAYDPDVVLDGIDNLGYTAWGIRATLDINTTDEFSLKK